LGRLLLYPHTLTTMLSATSRLLRACELSGRLTLRVAILVVCGRYRNEAE